MQQDTRYIRGMFMRVVSMGCFPGAWRRGPWHFQVASLHLPSSMDFFFSASHYFSFLGKRSGRRMPPAERSALCYILYTRALGSGPASVARSATRLCTARAPRRARGGPLEGRRRRKKCDICVTICRKQSKKKLRLHASRTSKRRESGCLGMSWRKELL